MRFFTRTAARLAWAGFQRLRGRAVSLAGNPGKLKKIATMATSRENLLAGPFRHAQRHLGLLTGLARDWAEGRYRVVPFKSIAAAAAALLYFLMPADAVLDWIPLAGLLDDAFVLGLVLRQLRADLGDYARWKSPPQ